MDLTVVLVVLILLMLPFVFIKGSRMEKKYNDAVKKNKQLITDLKLLEQENFYLKQMLNKDTD